MISPDSGDRFVGGIMSAEMRGFAVSAIRHHTAVAVAVAAFVPWCLCATATPAAAAGARPAACAHRVADDFDGDGYADVATGGYGRTVGFDDEVGSVQIDYGSAGGTVPARSQYLGEGTAGLPLTLGD